MRSGLACFIWRLRSKKHIVVATVFQANEYVGLAWRRVGPIVEDEHALFAAGRTRDRSYGKHVGGV